MKIEGSENEFSGVLGRVLDLEMENKNKNRGRERERERITEWKNIYMCELIKFSIALCFSF